MVLLQSVAGRQWYFIQILSRESDNCATSNIARVSKAHIPPAVAIRGHTTSRQKADYRKRYTSSVTSNKNIFINKKAKTIYPFILRMPDKKVQICIGVTDGKKNKVKKKKTKVNLRIIILFSVIELAILNMHIKFEVSNSYTD